MKYQAIRSVEGDLEFTAIARPLKEGDVQLYVVEASTWEEGLAEHHRRQGFEPYKPDGPETPCEVCGTPHYAQGSGNCGKCGSVEVAPLSTEEVEAILFYARAGLADRMVFDNCDHKTLVALCEDLLRWRGKL